MILFVILFAFSESLFAGEFRLLSAAGLMQQPSSQYYSTVYGASADFSTDEQTAILRGQYLQRPKYSSVGFEDQDIAYFGFVGTKVTKTKAHGLFAYAGGGTVQGYVKNIYTEQKSTYSMSGLGLSIEYSAHFGNFVGSFSHTSFSGYADNDQFQAYVVWPYNYFLLQLGMRVGGK